MQILDNLKDVQQVAILKPSDFKLMNLPEDLLQICQSTLLISTTLYHLHYQKARQQLKVFSEKASRLIVLLNGELQDGWHCRLHLLSQGKLNILQQIHLNHLSCLNSKKSSFPFHYRLRLYAASPMQDLQKFYHENKYFTSYLKKHPRNYHFWNFRIKFLKNLEIDLREQQINITANLLQSDIGNRSAANHLVNLLKAQQYPYFLQKFTKLLVTWQSLYTIQEAKQHLQTLRWLKASLNKSNDQFK